MKRDSHQVSIGRIADVIGNRRHSLRKHPSTTKTTFSEKVKKTKLMVQNQRGCDDGGRRSTGVITRLSQILKGGSLLRKARL
jgi:hypothetical protein